MHPKGFPYEGKLSPKATDEVDNAAKKQVPPTSSVTASPCHLPLVGEGIESAHKYKKGAV